MEPIPMPIPESVWGWKHGNTKKYYLGVTRTTKCECLLYLHSSPYGLNYIYIFIIIRLAFFWKFLLGWKPVYSDQTFFFVNVCPTRLRGGVSNTPCA